MKRMDRRTFALLASVGGTGAILTACGNDPDDVDLNPTMIPIDGAPPTLAPNATPGGGASEEPAPETGGGESAGGGTSASVTAVDIAFEPTEFTIAADTDVTITLTNEGVLEHNLVIEGTDYATDLLGGGESGELVVNLPAGDYIYFCSVAGHREAGMEGTLHVVEGGGEQAPAEEAGGGEEAAAAGAEGAATSAEVTAVDIGYEPTELTVAADTDVTIMLTNNGVLEHDLVIEDTDYATDLIAGGESAELVVNLPEGDYIYYCSVAGHREAGMEGTLHVVAGGGEEAAAEEAGGEEAAAAGAEGAATSAEVTAVDIAYEPTELTVAADTDVTITLTNNGVLEHDLVIEDTDYAIDLLGGGESGEVVVNLPEGDYIYFCSVAGHREAGMEGTLHVVAGGGEAAAPAGDDTSPEASGDIEPVTLEAVDPYQWSIGDLSVAPGQVIHVINTGLLEHDFVVDELAIDAPLPIGETVDVTVPDDAPVGDSYEFYCSIPGHRESGMKGTITIVEAPAGAEAQGGPSEEIEPEIPPIEDEVQTLMEDPEVVALEATDPYNWSWKAIEAYPGQIIRVLNLGVLEHDFVIDELDIKQMLPFGEPIDIQVPDSVSPGDTFIYYCSIPGHRELGMEGTLTIIEEGAMASPVAADGATPAAGEATPVAAAGGSDAATEVTVSAIELAFEPNEFTIAANTDVTLTLNNDGVLEHDLVIEDLDVATALLTAGQSDTVTINAAPGTYEFHCTVAGHAAAGMTGTVTVV